VTIFPEGTRMAPGQTRTYGTSAAALAAAANVPIVPVAHNAGDFWGRLSFNKRPGTVRFVIGPTIETGGRHPKQVNHEVQNWIESRMREISALYRENSA
jgi:1-acyl-sn-glycerol-3-phosphate acyltransferase